MPCSVCGEFNGSRWFEWRNGWFHSCAEDCINNIRAALAHERDRAKRVVRVFWRVRYPDSKRAGYKSYSRADAWRLARTYCDDGKIYRVVVRRVAR